MKPCLFELDRESDAGETGTDDYHVAVQSTSGGQCGVGRAVNSRHESFS
ncbi:Uncharacterised protein [Mycobacteroides abscessus subsp. massiliense]|nr:Uncharacterised protein [Mycobacteroides abscessus subsp. massiliense]